MLELLGDPLPGPNRDLECYFLSTRTYFLGKDWNVRGGDVPSPFLCIQNPRPSIWWPSYTVSLNVLIPQYFYFVPFTYDLGPSTEVSSSSWMKTKGGSTPLSPSFMSLFMRAPPLRSALAPVGAPFQLTSQTFYVGLLCFYEPIIARWPYSLLQTYHRTYYVMLLLTDFAFTNWIWPKDIVWTWAICKFRIFSSRSSKSFKRECCFHFLINCALLSTVG